MDTDFEFLCEKEEMWAKMLIQVLKEHDIPYAVFPVHGVGLIMRTGMRERLKIHVPKEKKDQAEALLDELFSQEAQNHG